jgi:hypothetical protein
MDKANAASNGEELPQHLLEAFHKLSHAGASSQANSSVLELKLEVDEQHLPKHSSQRAKLAESIREKSKKYRCVLSNRLMTSPVMAPDGNYYEQSCLEAHPSMSSEGVMLDSKLKSKIAEFSRESLKGLAGHLSEKGLPEDFFELTAECLSVISSETKTWFSMLGSVEGDAMTKLSAQLMYLVGEDDLITLMHHSTEGLPTLALCLAKLFMLKPLSERAFEEAFRCLIELLSQATLSAGAIDFTEQVSERLNSTQLCQMNQALKTQSREEEAELRMEKLRLKEAYLRLKEGDTETAVRLVSALQNTPHLEREVLEFYEEAGMPCEKISVLKHKLSTALELVGRESPSLAATLDTLQQLVYAELKALCSEAVAQQALSSLKVEVESLREDLAQIARQCKQAQSAKEAILQRLEVHSHEAEANEQDLYSLREEVLRLNRELAETKDLLQDTKEALYYMQTSQLHEGHAFIYSYTYDTDLLHRTSLVTGEQSSHQVPAYQFKWGCCWSEVPGGDLLITGGGCPAGREVVRIDVRTFEVSRQAGMRTSRREHAAVYHTPHLYVIGGIDSSYLRDCERFVSAHNRWEALPPLPRACRSTSGVVVEGSLYALGGYGEDSDLVQKLSLDRLTWELMQLRLPDVGEDIACFKLRDTEVYMVVNKTLYSFTAHQVLPIKTLAEDISSRCGASYYCRGTLYCSSYEGAAVRYEIGRLTS